MFFLIIPYVTPKLVTLFSIQFFIIDISYTIHLLINSFLILDKHYVDLILVHSLLISLQLCSFCKESLFQLFYHRSYAFFMLYFLSSSSYFPSLYLLFGDVLRCLCVSCLYSSIFFILLFHQGSDSFLFLLPQALRPIFFPI